MELIALLAAVVLPVAFGASLAVRGNRAERRRLGLVRARR